MEQCIESISLIIAHITSNGTFNLLLLSEVIFMFPLDARSVKLQALVTYIHEFFEPSCSSFAPSPLMRRTIRPIILIGRDEHHHGVIEFSNGLQFDYHGEAFANGYLSPSYGFSMAPFVTAAPQLSHVMELRFTNVSVLTVGFQFLSPI